MCIFLFFYWAAFLILILAYELPHWIPDRSLVMKISIESIIFALCEIATCVTIITILNDIPHPCSGSSGNKAYAGQQILIHEWWAAVGLYFFVLWPIMNTLGHIILICYLLRNVSVENCCIFFNEMFRFAQ